jgi:hypothetical protein
MSPDALVNLLSHWLARHVTDAQLASGLRDAQSETLSPDQADAVAELLDELDRGESRGELERVARETLEALALG